MYSGTLFHVQVMGKSTTKDRSKQVRTFDADGYRRRADAIIFKDRSFTEVCVHVHVCVCVYYVYVHVHGHSGCVGRVGVTTKDL